VFEGGHGTVPPALRSRSVAVREQMTESMSGVESVRFACPLDGCAGREGERSRRANGGAKEKSKERREKRKFSNRPVDSKTVTPKSSCPLEQGGEVNSPYGWWWR